MVDFKKLMTPYARHARKWGACTACPLSEARTNVVICRGVVPALVLFIGEAPGASEDALGKPFIGPAGKLLDRVTEAALAELPEADRLRGEIAWTNLVCCMPKDEEGRKRGEPHAAEVEACSPRLDEFLKLCCPKLIVAVGALSEKRAKDREWAKLAKIVSVIHPAAILRMDAAPSVIAQHRMKVQLSDAFADLLESL